MAGEGGGGLPTLSGPPSRCSLTVELNGGIEDSDQELCGDENPSPLHIVRSCSALSRSLDLEGSPDSPIPATASLMGVPRRRRSYATPGLSTSPEPLSYQPVRRYSHSVGTVETDSKAFMSLTLKALQLELDRLRSTDATLLSTLSELSMTVQGVVQSMTRVVPVGNLAMIGETFRKSIDVPPSSRSSSKRPSEQSVGTESTKLEPRPSSGEPAASPASQPSSPLTIPEHLEGGHQDMMQVFESMSLAVSGDGIERLLITDIDEGEEESTDEDDDDAGMGMRKRGSQHDISLLSPVVTKAAASRSLERVGATKPPVDRSKKPLMATMSALASRSMSPTSIRRNQQPVAANPKPSPGPKPKLAPKPAKPSPGPKPSLQPKPDIPPRRRRALFTGGREPNRDRNTPEEAGTPTAPASSLLSRLLRRSPTTRHGKSSDSEDCSPNTSRSTFFPDAVVSSCSSEHVLPPGSKGKSNKLVPNDPSLQQNPVNLSVDSADGCLAAGSAASGDIEHKTSWSGIFRSPSISRGDKRRLTLTRSTKKRDSIDVTPMSPDLPRARSSTMPSAPQQRARSGTMPSLPSAARRAARAAAATAKG